MAETANAPADSSVGAAMAAQPGVQAAQKESEKRAAADEKAYEKSQKDLESRLRKNAEDGAEDDLVESLRDPIDGHIHDSSTSNEVSAKSDLARPPGAGMSDDEMVRIANRHEDPSEVLAALRGGANPDDYRDPETDEVRTPSKASRSRSSDES